MYVLKPYAQAFETKEIDIIWARTHMRLNESTAILGDRVVLVPYRKEHVERYHEWMKSPELLEATASEPLSLEEEYEMQTKWHLDDDKLTFIVLARPESSTSSSSPPIPSDIMQYQMIGDTNLFLPDGVDGDVECEIMIAESNNRGKGLAGEIMSLMLNYAHANLKIPPTNFIARIGTSNTKSIRLFEQLGYGKEKVVEVFQEVTMRFAFGYKGDVEALAEEKWSHRGLTVAV